MRAYIAISIAALGMLAMFAFMRWVTVLERQWREADLDLTTFQMCLVLAASWLRRYWYLVAGALTLVALLLAGIPSKRHESEAH
jgi:hypothetical protein